MKEVLFSVNLFTEKRTPFRQKAGEGGYKCSGYLGKWGNGNSGTLGNLTSETICLFFCFSLFVQDYQ